MPTVTWAPGHATNVAINAAHEAATAAKTGEEMVDVRALLSAAGTTQILVHTPTGTTQTESGPRFIRTMRTRTRNLALKKKLAPWVPRCALSRDTTKALRRIVHAEDILHAILRRAIGPTRTTEQCSINGCDQPATIEHVLTCPAEDHHFWWSAGETPYKLRNMRRLIADYAFADVKAVMHVCNRLICILQEPTTTRWAKKLLCHL